MHMKDFQTLFPCMYTSDYTIQFDTFQDNKQLIEPQREKEHKNSPRLLKKYENSIITFNVTAF